MHSALAMNKARAAEDTRLFALSGMALVASNIVAKFLGAIYRIPLTNILGADGIGMYQLVFPVYALMLTLSSSGIPSSVSRLVSERRALMDSEGVIGVVKTAAIMLIILGSFFMVIMLLISEPLAHIQGNDSLRISYFAIAPAVLIVAASSAFKGYFSGMMNLTPTAVTGLVEQVVKMLVGLILASYLLGYGIEYAVMGAVIGLTSAELVSFLIMGIMYLRRRVSNSSIHLYRFSDYRNDIIRVSLPIALGGIIFPVMNVIDSILIVNILRSIGEESTRATALYGLLTGPVNTLINMPIVVTLSLAIMIVPSISASRIMRSPTKVRDKCKVAVKLACMVSVPSFFGLFVMAGYIMRVLYPSLGEADLLLGTTLLRVSSVSVILLALLQIMTAIVEALDKSRVGVKALLVAALVKVVMSIILIRHMSIVGASIASIIAYLVAVIIESLYLRRYLGKCYPLFVSITKILVAGLLMAGIVAIIALTIGNIYASLIVGVILGVAIYIISMLLLKVMDDEELLALPFGRLLVYFGKKLRFWESKNDRDNRTGNN